ncbi:uncharacterized protein N7473_012514 [Penicillium subrubescens]|uniref:Heterokaryon incompatibility protein s n=1 Tax=Penicillium subrubescens TaxID=1316194 RepID=A0A1Q5SRS5_9EURO|nr:uncharacterized protein N7473_012514 [Penicillium subrubescens]KAJ5875167.1 hypothetical protein N7473_012514 [Penicillium subrubescens]OKO90663.1 Heterokaryon incompatibility protein s [Penicillium subrubescens]
MVEPVGATLGAVSLATALSGIFVSVVECVEYVELGRHFGKDFDKSQARLAALKLQITRWGVSTGALPDPRTGRYRTLEVEIDVAATAVRLLSAIQDDILEVEKKSQNIRVQLSSTGRVDLATIGPNDMAAPTWTLNSQANAIVSNRVQGVSFVRKAKWAIYEKKHFDRLLDDITENLGHLEKLLPLSVARSLQDLCRIEVDSVQSGQSEAVIDLLKDASCANNDTHLQQAVREAITSGVSGHQWERTEVDDHVKLEQGDRIAMGYPCQVPTGRVGHSFGVTIGKGHSNIHQGDIYEST